MSYDLGPDDTPLPETVAVLPTQSSGEPIMALASYAEAPEASQALAAAATAASAPMAPELSAQVSGQAEQAGEAATGVAATEVTLPDGTMVPVPNAKAGTAVANAAGQTGSASQPEKGVVVASVETGSEMTEAALAPASLVKLDDPRAQLDQLIAKYAAVYEVPVDLVRRVVKRESNFNPSAFSRGHYGLMQIKHATARGMGYLGPARGLFDAETNLMYAVKYLRGAYLVADGDHERADRLYQRGYYYDAKRMGLLEETGLGTDRVRRRQPHL
ncbi:lytic transglycosylase domain-containing protein [Pseudaminobacter soli (ex Zhang et al. 2022)]